MELTVYQDNKIIRTEPTERVVYNPATGENPHVEVVQVPKEKVLILTFNNGDSIEKLEIRNLAEKRGEQTKEQLLNRRIIEGKGHIMVVDKEENRIIRISNIVSVETKWKTLDT